MSASPFRPVLEAGAAAAAVRVHQLIGPAQDRTLTWARAAVAWSVRHRFGASLCAIAQLLGRDHHTTIRAMVARAEQRRGRDPAFRALTDALAAGMPPPAPAPAPQPARVKPAGATPAAARTPSPPIRIRAYATPVAVGSAGVVSAAVPPTAPVERDPCFRCGVRADLGCAHRPPSRPADPFRLDRIAA